MATAEVEPAPALPDYLTNPNAVLGDTAEWRYGRAPDYSNTRKVYENSESTSPGFFYLSLWLPRSEDYRPNRCHYFNLHSS